MARLTDISFVHAGFTYTFAIDFDDAALVEDTIAFDVIVERTAGKSGTQSLSARVEIHPQQREIAVLAGGVEIAKLDGFNTQESEVEQALMALPAEFLADPVSACAIKAGVSAIIGQAVHCFRSLEDDGRWAAVSEFLRCMASNFTSISKTAMYRAFKCIVGTGGA